MKYRKLRIAWSVAWGVLAVLLLALWTRSYWRNDDVTYYNFIAGRVWGLQSHRGSLGFAYGSNQTFARPGKQPLWEYDSRKALYFDPEQPTIAIPPPRQFKFINQLPSSLFIDVPHWLAFCVAAAAVFAPWLQCWSNRFSLRTLLIATTLVAVVLGLIVWATRAR